MYYYRIVFVYLLLGLNLLGQEFPYTVEKLPLEKGISHNVVYCVTQDSEKFLWFGTMFGLIRYDGREFIKYRTDPNDYNTLSDDDIVTILESSDGKLWIGTFGGGVNSFEQSTKKIERFTPQNTGMVDWSGIVWEIIEDSQNSIWLATDRRGIIRITHDKKIVTEFKNTDSLQILPSNYIRSMMVEEKNVWIAGYNGLTKYNLNKDEFKVYSDDVIKNVFITSIIQFGNDELLCGSNKGIFSFSKSSGKFNQLTLTNYDLLDPLKINKILLTKNNEIWIGTNNGIIVCDKEMKFLHHIKAGEDGLYNNSIVSIHEDHSGIIWIGSYLGGVSKIFKKNKKFSLISHKKGDKISLAEGAVTDIVFDKRKDIWALTSKGVSRLNPNLEVVESFNAIKTNDLSIKDVLFTAIEIDANNNIFLGTNKGLQIVDSRFNLVKKITYESNGLSSNIINKLLIDSHENLWIGTVMGISKLNLKTWEITNWEPNSEKNKLTGQNVLSIFEDQEGVIWIGTYRGLNQINPLSGKVKFTGTAFNDDSKIRNKYLFDFLETDSTKVWIATGNGINIYDRKSNLFDQLTINDGLSNGVIESMINHVDFVFISTNYGISIYNKLSKSFRNYNSTDGIGNNIFSPGAALKTEQNRILMGGINGISVIHCDNFEDNEVVPINKITSINLLGSESQVKVLDNGFKLKYNQNSITVSFAALEYTMPGKNLFAYKLEGVDNDWVITKSNNVTYHLLPSNEYKFLLKSSNSDGQWNNIPTVASFEILPPFWNTYWFYLLIAAVLVCLALIFHFKRVQSKLKVFLKIEEAKQIESETVRKRAAEDFHDELGHHLTKISLLIELLKRKFSSADTDKNEYINRLGVLSTELSNKMRDFIWSLDTKNDTLYDLIIRLKDFGDDLFYDTSASFTLSGINDDLKSVKLSLDWRRHLTLIFKEAMNNIVKYSSCTNVVLKINKDNSFLKIELSDDGTGFDLSKMGRGNGIRNMKSRANYLKAKLAIISELNNGTQIKLEGMIS